MLKLLFRLSCVNQTFRYAVFNRSRYWKNIILIDAPRSFEPIFKRIFSTDLARMKNLVIDLDLHKSSFVTREIVAFVIEEFPNLKYLRISYCQRITVVDLIKIFTKFGDGLVRDSAGEYAGRHLSLEALDFNQCGTGKGFYWFEDGGKETAIHLATIERLLSEMCERGYCWLANSVCESCLVRVAYEADVCEECVEGSENEDSCDYYGDDGYDYEGGYHDDYDYEQGDEYDD
jgi:hypothetical protein